MAYLSCSAKPLVARNPLGPINDDMEVDTEANVYEPFEEYVKQVEVKPLKLIDMTVIV